MGEIEDITTIPSDAIRCVTGLSYKRLNPDTDGDRPGPDDTVTVRYTARSEEGQILEGTEPGGSPQTWSLRNVGPGLAEALQLLAPGEKVRAWIPPELSGNRQPSGGAGGVVYDIEMVSFIRVTKPPPIPEELKSPRRS